MFHVTNLTSPGSEYNPTPWADVETDKSLLYPMLYDWLRSQSPDDPATTEYDAWKGYIWGSRVGWDPSGSAASDLAGIASAAAAAAASKAAAMAGTGGAAQVELSC
jgi:hypothetical protein